MNKQVDGILIAEITRIEFTSVVWRRCRMNEMEEDKARALLMAFEKDQTKFYIIPDDASVKTKASHLISTHWKSGLRTLDSIQLASALEEKKQPWIVSFL